MRGAGGGGLLLALGQVTPVYTRCSDDCIAIKACVYSALHCPVGRGEAAFTIDVVTVGRNEHIVSGAKEEEDNRQDKKEGYACGWHEREEVIAIWQSISWLVVVF